MKYSNTIKIFVLGFVWVAVGIIISINSEQENTGKLQISIGLSIEALALLLFFWKKIKEK